MNNAKELITEAIDKLIPSDPKYFDYTMGLLRMALELGAISPEEKAELAAAASNAFWRKSRELKQSN